MDGKLAENSRSLRLRIAQTVPGTQIRLKVLRIGEQKLLNVTLSEAPQPPVQ
jgi:S1-C subfamily serine protease